MTVGSPAPTAVATGATLRETAIKSAAYLVGRETIGIGIRLLGLVLVMRQIGPASFGIYSAAAVFAVFPATLAQMGAEVFLARQPGSLPRRRYDEVFTTLLVSSCAVVVVGMGLSFVVAPWLRPHGVVLPLRILLLSVPINVLWAPMQACIERQFAYRRMGLLELGGDIVLYGTAVPLAFRGAGAWSLVAGYFAWQAWLLVGSMACSGLWPRLAWSTQTARQLFAHGRTYALKTWIFTARTAVVTLIIGAYTGAVGVGLVNFAYRLVLTMNFAERGVHRVGMVAISKANKERPERLAAALEEGTLLLMVLSALPFAAFGLVARWVIPDVFGHVWLPALPVYALLALWATLRVPVTVQRTLLYAYGRNMPPAITTAIEMVIVTLLSLVLVRTMGILGFGVASVVAVTSTAYTHWAAHRVVPVHYRRLVLPLVALVPPVFVALAPLPWAVLLLLPPAALFALPSMRQEMWHLVSTARATMCRGSTAAAPTRQVAVPVVARPVASVPVLVPPAFDVPVYDPPAYDVPVWSSPRPSGSVHLAIAVATFEAGGAEMSMNGSAHAGAGAPQFPPFQAWRIQAGKVVDPTDPRIADRAAALDNYGLRFPPVIPPLDAVAGAQPQVAGGHRFEPYAGDDVTEALLAKTDPVTGLPSATVFLARLGRLLGAMRDAGWSVAVVAVELRQRQRDPMAGTPTEEVLARVADGLRAELRFDDLLSRVDPRTFVTAFTLAGRETDGAQVAAYMESAARSALGAASVSAEPERWSVRSAHDIVPVPCDEDADELVRRVLGAFDG
jgi:O-antigen/teichoic acid export membrane protein